MKNNLSKKNRSRNSRLYSPEKQIEKWWDNFNESLYNKVKESRLWVH